MLTAWRSHRKLVAGMWQQPCSSWGLHHHCLPGRGVSVWLTRRLHWPAQRGCLDHSGTMPLPWLQCVSEPAGTARHLRLNRQGPRCHPWQHVHSYFLQLRMPGDNIGKLHQWSSGRIHRCHRCDPGSTWLMQCLWYFWPGQRTLADGMAFPSQARCRDVATAMF